MNIIGKIRFGRLSDEDLVNKFIETKKAEYVGELFSRYSKMVYGICLKYLENREESKDAVMSIFEKLMDTLLKHKIETFRPYLYQVAKNFCLMQIRSNNHYNVSIDIIPVVENDSEDIENELLLHENTERMLKEMAFLNDNQRICLDLFYLKNKSYKEIIEITGFSDVEVKSFIQNGKRNLKNFLTKIVIFLCFIYWFFK